jgi:ketosteroid isomerase-like protein
MSALFLHRSGEEVMSNRDEVARALHAFYDARGRGDLAATLDFIHPECTFRIMGNEELLPLTASASGLAEIAIAAEVLFASWDLSGLRSLDMTIEGDTACVHRHGVIRFIPSDVSFETELMDKIAFKEGKMIEFLQFVDTHIIAKVLA